VIRVYAFVSGLDRLPALSGVDGAALEQHGTDVTAVVSRHARSLRGDPRRDAVAHGLVVEALMTCADAVLPVRFGETLADEAALDRALAHRGDELRCALEHVRGCVEVGVRVFGSPPDHRVVDGTGTGTGYMRARLAVLGERDAIVRGLHERLERVARAVVEAPGATFEASYLVERAAVDAVQRAVTGFAGAHPELTVVCTGPWAPYSFGGTAA
jgi:hypothetical protein